jgi:hypothetical protein
MDNVKDLVNNSIYDKLGKRMSDQAVIELRGDVRSQVWVQVNNQVWVQIYRQVIIQVRESLQKEFDG